MSVPFVSDVSEPCVVTGRKHHWTPTGEQQTSNTPLAFVLCRQCGISARIAMELKDEDISVQIFRASVPEKEYPLVTLVHHPTGLVVQNAETHAETLNRRYARVQLELMHKLGPR